MEQVSSTQSISEINSALLAQYAADKKLAAAQSRSTSGASFSDTLSSIEMAPTPLIDMNGKAPSLYRSASLPASSSVTTAQLEVDTPDEEITEFKVVRGGEKADCYRETHVSYQDESLEWGDVVDLLNPLQHIPVVGSIYRAITGDEIKPEIQVAGSLALGAATGSILLSGAAGVVSALYEQKTGQEPTVMVADALWGDETVQTPDVVSEKKVVVAENSYVNAEVQSAPVERQEIKTDSQKKQAESLATQTSSVSSNKPKTLGGRLAAAQAASGATRIGNTIHTGNTLKNTNMTKRVATVTPVTTHSKTQEVQAASTTETTQETLPVVSDDTFNVLLQEQAQARQSGQKVDPQTVQGLMLKALDKYQAMAQTSNAATVTETTTVQ